MSCTGSCFFKYTLDVKGLGQKCSSVIVHYYRVHRMPVHWPKASATVRPGEGVGSDGTLPGSGFIVGTRGGEISESFLSC